MLRVLSISVSRCACASMYFICEIKKAPRWLLPFMNAYTDATSTAVRG